MKPFFKRIYQVTGTLDNFVAKLNYAPQDPLSRMRQAIGKMADQVYLKKVDLNMELLEKRFGPDGWFRYDASRGNHNRIAYVDKGFIGNAGDSLIARMNVNIQFVADLKIKFYYDGKTISFEVEDNGTGIDPEVEPFIFSEDMDSNKKNSSIKRAYIGGLGEHMFFSKEKIKKIGGNIHFENKGPNQGARFWYEIPANKLK